MGTDNKDLIQKADMALSDLATAGVLTPEQDSRFIRKLMDTPTILSAVRTIGMTGPTKEINKLGFGTRMLRPAVSATALQSSDRYKPSTEKITLTTKEIMAEINLPYDVIEDNIEGGRIDGALQAPAGGLHQTIVDMMAERAAVDLEELLIQGDTGSGDAYLALKDGYLKRMTSNVVTVGGTLTKTAIKNGVKAMPDRYLRNRASMVHYFSVDNETEMRDQYASRQTALGDQNLQGNLPLYMFGSQLKGVPLMPAANGFFCDPLNLIFGIQRRIQIEYDKDIRARVFIIVLTLRVDLTIEEETACVKYQSIS